MYPLAGLLRQARLSTDQGHQESGVFGMRFETAKQAWEAALASLELQVSRPIFRTWLKDTTGLSLEGDRIVVGTPSTFVAEWLEKRMSSLIESALSQVMGQRMEARFEVLTEQTPPAALKPGPGRSPEPRPTATVAAHPAPTANGRAPLNRRYTLASFVVGASNQLAYAAALAVCSKPGEAYNPLYLYAGVGLGKTHLLQAIGHASTANGLSCLYVSSDQFTNDFVTSIQTRKTREFREKYHSVDVLLMDDIQFMRGREATQEGFFHAFNDLHNSNRQIVIASDRHSSALQPLEDRLRSRFEWGLAADIQSPDQETRLAILQAKAGNNGVSMPLDVQELIADNFPTNIRELEGALNRVCAFSDFTGRPPTLDLAHEALGNVLTHDTSAIPSPEAIIAVVCSFYGTSPEALQSKRRDKTTAHARQVAVYLLREIALKNLREIGALLGHRDHATIRYSLMKVTDLRESDATLRSDISAITELITK